ncbi:receptor-activated Ca2+-permeable cation channel [Myriangium duriaei CBS 260.36]|uniref:Receptor-activated Ca2+-permeable cation channel n=1 Tax=Myriangium duriaei CBS 260.36 TaxID=1168546 RepID=A0A9P4MLQ8_9PEZI|nr:receptor-activated Ca2+-permeable cation channel [Myriangium duriaei CBS 260.36]
MNDENISWLNRATTWATRRDSDESRGSGPRGSGNHITMQLPTPKRPRPDREQSSRSISEAMRLLRSSEEQQTLLGDEELADDDGCFPPRKNDDPQAPNPHADLPVYTTIHRIRRLVIASIDDPYDRAMLLSPRVNVAIVRPLVEHLYDPDDASIVYCLLINRAQFLREQSYQAHHQTVNITRANLCEIVAARILRRYDEDHTGRSGLLMLANVLVAGFEPFQNAPSSVVLEKEHSRWGIAESWFQANRKRMLTALEVAIVSESKLFLATTACQKVVDAVWRGRITYTPTAWLDLVPDRYKHRGISLYDPRRAPYLNQYRLIVPRTRNIIETTQFIILFVLYILTMTSKAHTIGPSHLNFTAQELLFAIYGMGWCLDEFASVLEHGWSVHTQNLWAFLDLTFVAIYSAYFGLRMHGLSTNSGIQGKQALDVLSLAAPVLLPRLAFCLMSESMLFIALRAMMADFLFLTVLTVWCFGGFLLAMRWLSESQEGYESHKPVDIAKWMIYLWFGLDGTGIQTSPEFHPFLGPLLMTTFTFLGNSLFLTILVAMLSDTYSKLAASATAEVQFRRAVLTFEGVKADALFSYPPPFNVAFLFVLLPLKMITTPRWFHKINVLFVRTLNAPVLFLISLYERRFLWKKQSSATFSGGRGDRTVFSFWEQFGAHADMQLVFEHEPPNEVQDRMDDLDQAFTEDLWENAEGLSVGPSLVTRKRRNSGAISEASGSIFPNARLTRRALSRSEYRV